MLNERIEAERILRKTGIYDEILSFLDSEEAKKIMREEFDFICNKIQTECDLASEELKPVLNQVKKQVEEKEEVFFADIRDTLLINIVLKLFNNIEKNPQIHTVVVEEFKRELRMKDEFVKYLLRESATAVGKGTNNLFILLSTEYFLKNSEP